MKQNVSILSFAKGNKLYHFIRVTIFSSGFFENARGRERNAMRNKLIKKLAKFFECKLGLSIIKIEFQPAPNSEADEILEIRVYVPTQS